MLRIGYVRLSDTDRADAAQALRDLGCHVIRVEEDGETAELQPMLGSVLDFIGEGDELVTLRLKDLASSPRALLEIVARLDARAASLTVADPPLSSAGIEGQILRNLLYALAGLEPAEAPRRRARAPAHEIRALQRAGMGPVEIARRLGVSRMTVWRKLRRVEA